MRSVKEEVCYTHSMVLCTRTDWDIQEYMDQDMQKGGKKGSRKDMALRCKSLTISPLNQPGS